MYFKSMPRTTCETKNRIIFFQTLIPHDIIYTNYGLYIMMGMLRPMALSSITIILLMGLTC